MTEKNKTWEITVFVIKHQFTCWLSVFEDGESLGQYLESSDNNEYIEWIKPVITTVTAPTCDSE